MPLEGLQLGKYRLLRLIGSGGMGDVYIGLDANINRQVAIKVMRAEVSPYPTEDVNKQARHLFQREMKAIAALDHPYILPLYDYGEEGLHNTTLMYMVMPFRQEGSFADWLRQYRGGKLLELREIAYFLTQAADALQHAHDMQIIHQDVKPSNFLIRSKRDVSKLPDLLLADFGIAKISSLTASISHSSRGTPSYMAPEQWSGEPVFATDQYALAVMTYELLTGRPPFRGRPEQMMFMHFSTSPQPPRTLNKTLPASIDVIILRALAKKPEERFASVSAFSTAFQQTIQGTGDLHATLAISKTEASAGTKRELTLPGSRKAQVVIPQGAQHGQVLRLDGLGEPYYDGGPTGALVLTIVVSSEYEAVPPHTRAYDETVMSKGIAQNLGETVLAGSASSLTPSKEAAAKMDASAVQKTKGQWLEEGDKLYSARRYHEALAAYEQGLQLAPTDPALREKCKRVCSYLGIPFAKRFPTSETPPSTPLVPSTSMPAKVDGGKAKVAEGTKEYWLEKGDKLYTSRSYQEALAAYDRGLQIAPYDTTLRTKYNRVRDYLSKPAPGSVDSREQDGMPFFRRGEFLIGAVITVALFLMVNVYSQWDSYTFTFTLLLGLVVLVVLGYFNRR